MTRYLLIVVNLSLVLLFFPLTTAWAGPPFLTDDPEPVPYHHWEFYTFMASDKTRSSTTVNGPAVELNNGIAPNTQLHLIVPYTYFGQNGSSAAGLGDTELGVKYRLFEETKSHPEIGIFPQLELPTGDASKGLGNGRTWVRLPLWLQKDWGQWTSYGGGGYAYNRARGQRSYYFVGCLVQRTLSPSLALGGEVYLQGATADAVPGVETPGARSTAIWNVGGQFNFTPDFSLLFSSGHSFQGDGNSVLYLGLYRTWGPGSP